MGVVLSFVLQCEPNPARLGPEGASKFTVAWKPHLHQLYIKKHLYY
jgi:hypothetical protein